MPEIQRRQLKQAFYAGFMQLLAIMKTETYDDENQAVKMFENFFNEGMEFFKKEAEEHKKRGI